MTEAYDFLAAHPTYDKNEHRVHKEPLKDIRMDPYWSRPACGLTFKKYSKQKVYVSGMDIRCCIWVCLKFGRKAQDAPGWEDTAEALDFEKQLRASVEAAANMSFD